MNEYCIFAQYCFYEYTCLHSSKCIAPARDSPLFSNEPAFPQTFGEDFSPPPVASINPSKMDVASPSAASGFCCEPAGEASRKRLFGIDRDSVYSRGGDTGLHDLYFPRQHTQERYLAQGPRAEEGLRGHPRSRLLDTTTVETTSTVGEVLGDGRNSN